MDKKEIEIAAQKWSDENTIVLETPDGKKGDEKHVKAAMYEGKREDKDVTFIVPSGYRRFQFSKNIETNGHAGGDVTWVNNDPHDATIRLHVWADPAWNEATAKVWNVLGIKE